MEDTIFEVTEVQSVSAIPYPNLVTRKLLRLPIWMYRAGLGWLMNLLQIMVLTTEGRKTGLPRHTAIEFRAHGRKLYVVSAWGERPDWYRNLLANPSVSLFQGNNRFSAQAQPVTDSSEALRVLNLFRKTAPARYDAIMSLMSTRDTVSMDNLPDISGEFTIVRFDPVPGRLLLPTVPTDRRWVWPAVLAGLLLMMVVRRTKA